MSVDDETREEAVERCGCDQSIALQAELKRAREDMEAIMDGKMDPPFAHAIVMECRALRAEVARLKGLLEQIEVMTRLPALSPKVPHE